MITRAFRRELARLLAATHAPWLQLHVGDPGPDGVLGWSTDARRQGSSLAVVEGSDGTLLATTATLRWDNFDAPPGYPQRLTWLSFWSEAQDGSFWFATPLVHPLIVPRGAVLEIPAGITFQL